MPATTLTCDQAIFTSVRTPMGEGYRIIAKSRGLRPEEAQAITRNSPSHEGLCAPCHDHVMDSEHVAGAAFYPLPGGRLCVALSCFAGAEHTGRGGQRVFTHNVIFDAACFADCGFSAFNVLRAMVAAGLSRPQLKPPAALPEIELTVNRSAATGAAGPLHPALRRELRRRVLDGMWNDRRFIINIDGRWVESAEALLLGLPGPLRGKISFGAGLRFSVSHAHHLDVFHDESNATRAKIVGQPVEYLDTGTTFEQPANESAWTTFVDRHWERGDLRTLADRTSREFDDVTPAGCARVGTLYNDIDAIPQTDFADLLRKVGPRLSSPGRTVEHNIAAEFAAKVKSELSGRLRSARWVEARACWPDLVAMWKNSDNGAAFAQPLIHESLRLALREDPMAAAEAAYQVAGDFPTGVDMNAHQAVLDEVARRLVALAATNPNGDDPRLQALCDQWRALRPHCFAPRGADAGRPEPVGPASGDSHRYSIS